MRKLKHLFAAFALTASTAVWAQEDVTNTYLDNADFSSGTLAEPAICTYAKDKATNGTEYANLVELDSWTAVDNGDGKAGGPVAIGSGVWVGGSGYTAPATNSDGEVTGNVLGLVACWTGSAEYRQDLKTALPAGTYTIVLAAYNSKGGTNAIEKNLIGFVEEGGTEHFATTTAYPVNTWKYEFITFTLTEETTGYVSLGYTSTNTGSGNMPHLFISGLEIYNGEIDAEAYEAAKTAIREAKEAKVYWDLAKAAADKAWLDESYINVTGDEKTALEAEVAKEEPTTKDDYNIATEALTNATMAFTAAKASYDSYVAEIVVAAAFGVDAVAAPTTAAEAENAVKELKVSEYTAITGTYKNDVSDLLGSWNGGDYGTISGEGYIADESYFDKWNGSSIELSSSKNMILPEGQYVVMVAGRGVVGTEMILSVKIGEGEAVSTPFLMEGNTGLGIDVDGNANYSDGGTYANENNGRGWSYSYLPINSDGTSEITISINGKLNAGTWQSFYSPVLLCDDATYTSAQIMAAKVILQEYIDKAPAVPVATGGAFQYATDDVSAYEIARKDAQGALEDAGATLESIENAKIAFEKAVDEFKALEMIAPAEGQLFNVILTADGWTYDNKAVTYLAGDRDDMGEYNIKYQADANKNMAQAFTFTKVSGNNYKMSQIDDDGEVRYISTGTIYGGNAFQIRTTLNESEALEVTIIPANTEGVYNLYNTEAEQYIGSQDAGFFTVNSHIDFKIVETTKPSIDINTTAAGWGTVILPFGGLEVPATVKAYTCAEVDGTTLVLVEESVLEANKPYIIEGAWKETVSHNAIGKMLSNTAGLLTGVYDEEDVPVGSYVLQNLDGKVGFYQVAEEKQPKITANHAYLSVADGARAYFLGGDATGIEVVKALLSGKAEIYDASGVRQNGLQKGVNIIKQSGKTMKVMVK